MNPTQHQEYMEAMRAEIRTVVNGKIDKMSQKLDDHIVVETEFREQMRPYLEGAKGLGIVWKFLIAVGSLAISWIALKNVLKI